MVTDFQHPTERLCAARRKTIDATSLLGDHSEREPPDPIPNSEVKPFSADDSVAVCHAKVGNRQALKPQPKLKQLGFFFAKKVEINPELLLVIPLLQD